MIIGRRRDSSLAGAPCYIGGNLAGWLAGPLIYIGTLAALTSAHYVLTDANVHDTNDSRSGKELYLLETRDLGVRANRARVLIERREIVSLSLLTDIRD